MIKQFRRARWKEAAGLVCVTSSVTLLHSVGEGQVQELRPLVE